MKKAILALFLASILFSPVNLTAQYKKIYLWDVTLSMKGYNPDDEDIYKEVLEWMVKDINDTKNQNTTIVVCPFQAPYENHETILDTKRELATPAGKESIIKWIKSRNYTDPTKTDIAGAMEYVRLNMVTERDQLIILTDGKQSPSLGGNPRLLEEIAKWCKYASTLKAAPFALYFMLTPQAVDETIKESVDLCKYMGLVDPSSRSKDTFIIYPQDNIKANIKDDERVSLFFSSDSSLPIPEGVKIKVTCPSNADYLEIDGTYEIVNNQITIPLKYSLPFEQLRNYGNFRGNEYVNLELGLELINTQFEDANVNLNGYSTILTLINKPEKTVRIRIKND